MNVQRQKLNLPKRLLCCVVVPGGIAEVKRLYFAALCCAYQVDVATEAGKPSKNAFS